MTRMMLPTLLLLTACELEDTKETEDTGTASTDADGDGFAADEDCDDSNAAISPDAAEICDGVDNDCDDLIDDEDDSVDVSTGGTFYADGDDDGYGSDTTAEACAAPSGYTDAAGDCDDSNAAIGPDAAEVCDGIDNDCDDLIDDDDDSTDLSTGTVAHADVDGDGFGDLKTAQEVCVLPKGTTEDSSDCDDNDAAISPAAAELCDSVDNDCDPKTAEVGVASWAAEDGTWSDWTAALTPAGSGAVDVDLSEPGTLYLCEGTWALNIDISNDVSIIAPAGPEVTTIDAQGVGQAVHVSTGSDVYITGTAITGGIGEGLFFGAYDVGGGVYCEGGSSLVIQDADIHTNSAGMGAGMFSSACDVTISDSTIRDNTALYAGGGVAAFDGTALIEYSTVSGNAVPDGITGVGGYGGGLLVFTDQSSVIAVMDLVETIVEENIGYYGSGFFIPSAEATCTGATGSGNGGFYANTNTGTGAVQVDYGSTFTATDCDFGAAKSADDNAPFDVYVSSIDTAYTYSYGDDESFTCTGSCY